MSAHAQVEAAEPVPRQGVAAALEHHGLGLVVFHDGVNDGLEDGIVRDVVDAVPQRKVDRVVLAEAYPDVAQLAGPGEVLAVLVEGDGHDSVGGVESLFDAIAVVNIDVDVQNALLEPEELDDRQDNVWRFAPASAGYPGAFSGGGVGGP